MNSILLKKSSLLCQKSEYSNSPMETLSGSSPEREDEPMPNNLQEISQSKRDSNFAKSCKISEIYRSGLSNSLTHKPTDKAHVKKKVNASKSSTCDFTICDDPINDNSTKSREFDSMPQLYDFSNEKPMPILPANYTENHRTLSNMLLDAPAKLDLHSEPKDNADKEDTDSDDSCMILDTPERIGFNLFRKDYKLVDQNFTDDLKYKHKQTVISGIYGKGDKSAQKKDSSFDDDMETLDSSSSAPKLTSEQSAISDSDSIETSSSSCSELYSPIPQEYPDVTESHQNTNITQTTSFEDSCENSGSESTA